MTSKLPKSINLFYVLCLPKIFGTHYNIFLKAHLLLITKKNEKMKIRFLLKNYLLCIYSRKSRRQDNSVIG